jgi:hypothetical protein
MGELAKAKAFQQRGPGGHGDSNERDIPIKPSDVMPACAGIHLELQPVSAGIEMTTVQREA